MSRDYSQPADQYGIADAYTAQSFTADSGAPMRSSDTDVRGNAILVPRGIPTQEEADAIANS